MPTRTSGLFGMTVLLVSAAILLPAQSMSEEKIFGQFRLLHWTDVEGLPENQVASIAATSDGYLWFATAEGVGRFDGVNFAKFGARALGQESPDSRVLLADRSGTLWIANRTGALTLYRDHKFQPLPLAEQLGYIYQMVQDRDGTIWIPSSSRGLAFVRDGRIGFLTKRDGLPSDHVTSVAQDASGRLWIGTSRGLVRMENGRIQAAVESNEPIAALCIDRDDNLWLGTPRRVLKRSLSQQKVLYERAADPVYSLYADRQNRVWVGTLHGITLIARGQASSLELTPDDYVQSILEDSDETLWLGTGRTGLYALRDAAVAMYSPGPMKGLDMRAIVQDRNGAMWFATPTRIFRKMPAAEALPVTTEGQVFGNTLAEDPQGGMWLSERGKAQLYRDGKMVRSVDPHFEHNLVSIYADRQGALWLGSTDAGFCRYQSDLLQCFRDPDLAGAFTNNIYEDRAGSVWIATGKGLFRWREGNYQKWTAKDGLATDNVVSFHETGNGSLWIGGGSGGLSRFKNGRFSKVTSAQGLFDDVAFAILEDDLGDLWMSSNHGIYRVSLNDLEECADGRRQTVRSYSYGVEDGMISREANGANPAAWKSNDGTFWFATVRGAVMIDPRRMNVGRPPRVELEAALVDGQPVADLAHVQLGSDQSNLELRYTALRCLRPKGAHFKVKLEGLETNWTDMAQDRSVRYFRLPPGNFTFRVIADDGEGAWNMTGASLPISVSGPFYRTWWFQVLCGLLVAGLVAGAWYRNRRGMVEAAARQRDFLGKLIESQEQERRRLAGELHDGLAQRLTLMKNQALLAGRGGDSGGAYLTAIAEQAGEALREVREISHALRPYQLDYLGLKESLEALVRSASLSGPTELTCEIADLQDALGKDVEVHLYRIAQECLQNIFKHAGAAHANLVLERLGGQVRLSISDDGRGFQPGARPGGLGLTSMTERVQLLGGDIEISSGPGQGTRIKITVPVSASTSASE